MTLGKRIQELRKSKGWSQEMLAEKINVSRQALSKWESDTAAPNVENIAQLSKMFGVTADYLITGEEDKADEPVVDQGAKKKIDFKFVVVIAIAVVLFIMVVFLWSNLRNLQDQLANIEPQVIYEYDTEYPDPLFYEESCEVIEGSLSAEKGTVDYKVKLIPAELNDRNTIRIKAVGETFEEEYNLERDDNTFTGVITVSAFEEFYIRAILEDGTLTETGSAGGASAYCYSLFSYAIGGYSLSWFENKVRVNNGVHFYGEYDDDVPQNITVVLKQEEKEVYSKELSLALDKYGEQFFEWQDSIEIPNENNTDIYFVHKDENGFKYEYKAGYLNKGSDWPTEKDRGLKIFNPDGKMIYERWISDEE